MKIKEKKFPHFKHIKKSSSQKSLVEMVEEDGL